MLKVTSKTLEDMFQQCKKEYPNEACGYLVGKRDGIATKAYNIKNRLADPSSYEMEAIPQMVLQKMLRNMNLEELAIYHSHVATEAYPSRRDIDRATAIQDFFDGYYVIVTLKDSIPRARAFKIRDGNVTEEELIET